MGVAHFRVEGRIFATLASADKGYGSLMLTPEKQAAFVTEAPEVFLPIAGLVVAEKHTFTLRRLAKMCCSVRCAPRGSRA